MTPERWATIGEVFAQAMETPEAERVRFLAEACGSDVELRAHVEELLAADREGSLQSPVANLFPAARELAPGDVVGPYRIEVKLGAGGMGVVYRATDSRLRRSVALKCVNSPFGDRAQREARVAASLAHPHICTVYDVGPNYLVMELVEGPTLAERTAKGAIPLREALAIARQIAGALEAAHEKGIVHRDLKPANIKITSEDQVKVLDFGLATTQFTAGQGSPDDSATVTGRYTSPGTILGTAAYMSPEQASGRPVDQRADIWAFGAVLYEMLAGRTAFHGDSVSEILASVLKEDPDWSALPPLIPTHIQKLLRRCLTRQLKDRLHAIGDVRLYLDDLLEPGDQVQSRYRPIEERPVRLSLLPPEKTSFETLVISPDGRQFAFTAKDTSGRIQLWLRPLDSTVARLIEGTEDAAFPFWSPDSRYIGFMAEGKLKKIDPGGGPAQIVCDTVTLRGVSWSSNGTIIFAPDSSGPLLRVAAAGGKPEPLTQLDQSKQEISHRWPSFLPDGRHYLFAVRSISSAVAGVYVGALDTTAKTRLLPEVSNAAYVPARSGEGRLLFLCGGVLMSRPFDADRLQMSGEAVAVADHVGFSTGFSRAAYSVSQNGILVFAPVLPAENVELSWFDRSGKFLGTCSSPGDNLWPRLSPDDKKLLWARTDSQSGLRDIWVADLTRGVSSRVRAGATQAAAIWSADGKRITFPAPTTKPLELFSAYAGGRTTTTDNLDVFEEDTSGAQGQEVLLKSAGRPLDWSSDGRRLLLGRGRALWVQPFSGRRPGERRPGEPFLFRDKVHTNTGAFSPDAKWIAYESEESGKTEVYVEGFGAVTASRKPTRRWQISNNGGILPRWRRDGKELFFISTANSQRHRAGESEVMSVKIKTSDAAWEPGVSQPLFPVRLSNVIDVGFAPTGDGRRFLVSVTSCASDATAATVILNWPAKA